MVSLGEEDPFISYIGEEYIVHMLVDGASSILLIYLSITMLTGLWAGVPFYMVCALPGELVI